MTVYSKLNCKNISIVVKINYITNTVKGSVGDVRNNNKRLKNAQEMDSFIWSTIMTDKIRKEGNTMTSDMKKCQECVMKDKTKI
jgi:hypothetical protein